MPTKLRPLTVVNTSAISRWDSADNSTITTNPQVMQGITSAGGVITGVNNAGWKARAKIGVQAGSPYEADRYWLTRSEGSTYQLFYTLPANGRKLVERGLGIHFPVTTFNHLSTSAAQCEADALKRLYSRIRSERTSINGFNFLGELRETIKMLRHPAEALLKQVDRHFLSLENTKRKVLRLPVHKRRAQWEKAVAGSALEINFGWKPLISDAKAIAEAIGRLVEQPPRRHRIQASGTQSNSELVLTYSDDANVNGWGSYQITTKTDTQRVVRYIVGMDTEVQVASTALGRLQDSFGFKLEDFVPTIYELTPWSWLVDYFSNIGDIIEAGSTDTTAVKWIVRTERVGSERSVLTRPIGTNPSRSGSWVLTLARGSAGSQQLIRRTVVRTTPTTLGLPPLVFTHPGESFGKMVSLLSVVAQRRKGLEDLSYMPTHYDQFGRRVK